MAVRYGLAGSGDNDMGGSTDERFLNIRSCGLEQSLDPGGSGVDPLLWTP